MSYEIYSFLHIKNIIDKYNINQQSWSIGKDFAGGISDPLAFVIMEEIYCSIQKRPEYCSIKYIKSLKDNQAYKWHNDSDNPNETKIETSVLVYLPTCEKSQIEFKSGIYETKPYDVLVFKKNIIHRAVGKNHGPLLKYTFYDDRIIT